MGTHNIRAHGSLSILCHDDIEIAVRLMFQTRQRAVECIRVAICPDQHREMHAAHVVRTDGLVCALKARAARRLALRHRDGARRDADAKALFPQRARQRGDGVGPVLRETARRLKYRPPHSEARSVELARLERERMIEFRVLIRQRAHLHRADQRRAVLQCLCELAPRIVPGQRAGDAKASHSLPQPDASSLRDAESCSLPVSHARTCQSGTLTPRTPSRHSRVPPARQIVTVVIALPILSGIHFVGNTTLFRPITGYLYITSEG